MSNMLLNVDFDENLKNTDYGVLIGRFNPPHIGHIELMKDALSKCNKLLFIIVGSDLAIRTNSNAFFADERIQMLELCLYGCGVERVRFLPMQDFNNPVVWADHVTNLVFDHPEYERGNSIGLFGFNKDASSFYLKMFPQFTQMIISNSYYNGLSSTSIRNKFCGKSDDRSIGRPSEGGKSLVRPSEGGDYSDKTKYTNVTSMQFLYDKETSIIDTDNLHKYVCYWLEHLFNPNIKFNEKIIDMLKPFVRNRLHKTIEPEWTFEQEVDSKYKLAIEMYERSCTGYELSIAIIPSLPHNQQFLTDP